MKIKELEQASGLPRASIRFYEKEGLLAPAREETAIGIIPKKTWRP